MWRHVTLGVWCLRFETAWWSPLEGLKCPFHLWRWNYAVLKRQAPVSRRHIDGNGYLQRYMLLCILETLVKPSAVKERSVNTTTVHCFNSFSCHYRKWLADCTVLWSQLAETPVSLIQILLRHIYFLCFFFVFSWRQRTVLWWAASSDKKKLTFYVGHLFGRRIKLFKLVYCLW